MKKNTLFTAALLAGASAIAGTTNQIVVSATRIDTPIEQVGSSISVVTADQIKQQNAQNLQDALRLVPGLQTSSSGGPGTASSVFIRGAESDHTLVQINGIRVNSNTSGDFDFSSIPVDMVENIEVLRGPQSGLHGADAMGGVINITTKKGSDAPLGGSIKTDIGEKGYKSGSITLHGGNKTIDFNTSISALALSDYDIAENNGGIEDDPYERASAYANLGLNFASEGRADLTLLYTDNQTKLDAYRGVDNPIDRTDQQKLFTALSIRKSITDFYTQKISAGYNKQKYGGVVSGWFGGPVDYQTISYDASFQSDLMPTQNDTLSIGYDIRRTEAENAGNFSSHHRTQHALFLNNQWNWKESLFINLGGRYDDFSDLEGKATWKASASWFALATSRFHGSAGTAYRAPSMNDIYFTYGGPARSYLKPEESQAFDMGIEQTFLDGNMIADITYFQSDVTDLIEWAEVPVGSGIWRPDNVDEANIKGVETSLSVKPIKSITTRLFYTYTDAQNGITGKELARRAKHTGGASIGWDYSKKGTIYTDLTYTGGRYEDAGNFTKLEEFVLVGIGTRYAVSDSASVVAHVSNLFDKYYETSAGYGPVGRVASAGIEITF